MLFLRFPVEARHVFSNVHFLFLSNLIRVLHLLRFPLHLQRDWIAHPSAATKTLHRRMLSLLLPSSLARIPQAFTCSVILRTPQMFIPFRPSLPSVSIPWLRDTHVQQHRAAEFLTCLWELQWRLWLIGSYFSLTTRLTPTHKRHLIKPSALSSYEAVQSSTNCTTELQPLSWRQ